MTISKAFLDMDGLISDFVGGVLKKFGREDPYKSPESKGNWWIQKILGLSDEEFYGALDFGFWAGLPKTQEADGIVEFLAEQFGSKNLFILTTPCHSEGCYAGKYAWIEKHYPSLRRNLILTKHKYLLAGKDRLLVDDSDENVKSFQQWGGKFFLFPRAWNSWWKEEGDGLRLLKEFVEEVN